MTTKLTFRSRNLDAYRPLPIYHAEELPEPTEINAINRSVPAMPTGMEKEEESEKHLQDILERNGADDLYIPTPEVFSLDVNSQYKKMYRGGYNPPRQYIHVQPFNPDSEAPSYDMDSEDDEFLQGDLKAKRSIEVDPLKFEEMIDKLEKNSGHNVVTANEAKHLLSGGDELVMAVYDYWVDKRLKLRHPLIPAVKSDKRDLVMLQSGIVTNPNTSSNPYIAFRRRTEKMQTRKNRKNDETSYEKMLKLRRDLARAILIIDMIKTRESNKKDLIMLALQIFEKRFHSGDFEGKVIQEVNAQKAAQRMALQPNRYAESWVKYHNNLVQHQTSEQLNLNSDKNRRDKKRRSLHLTKSSNLNLTARSYYPISTNGPEFGTIYGSDEERDGGRISHESGETHENARSPFLFRRKDNCWYFKNKRYLPFGISRPSKQLKLETRPSVENAAAEETESSDTSDDDDDDDDNFEHGADRKILWSTTGIPDLKKHAKDYFPCSFHPLPAQSIAFASRRLSRNSRMAIDLAQVTLPKKLEEEGPFVEVKGVHGLKEQIMVPREFETVTRRPTMAIGNAKAYAIARAKANANANAEDDWFSGISQTTPDHPTIDKTNLRELSPRSATTVNFSLAQVHNSKIQRSTLPKPVLSKAFALKMLSAGPAIVPRVAGLHGAAPSTVVSHKFKKTL